MFDLQGFVYMFGNILIKLFLLSETIKKICYFCHFKKME